MVALKTGLGMPYAQALPPSYNLSDPAEKVYPDGEPGMRIVHLSTYDVTGGASRAAYRIHSGLRQAGVHSSMLVRESRTKDQSVITFDPPQTLYRRVARRTVQRRRIGHTRQQVQDGAPAGDFVALGCSRQSQVLAAYIDDLIAPLAKIDGQPFD